MATGGERRGPADSTLTRHAGEGPHAVGSPLNAPPTFSTSYHTHRDAVGSSATDLTEDGPSFYTRRGNPTLDLLERRLAALPASPSAWKTPTT